MAKQTLNLGTVANDNTGTSLRVGGDMINDNFTEIYGVNGVLKSNGSDTLSAETNLLYDNVEEEYTKTQNFNGTSASHNTTSDYTWVLGSNQVHALTAENNFTIVFSGAVDGATYLLKLIQDGTGSRAVSWGANFKFEGGTAPTQTTGAGDISLWSFYSDGTYLYGTGLIDLG